MHRLSIETADWLTRGQADRWLTEAQERLTAGQELVRVVAGLRRWLAEPQAAAVLEQLELRVRARTKFSLASRMLFTRRGLEQATSEALSAYKSTRFDRQGVADLCCGIGGDLMGLGQGRECLALDDDPVAILLARYNAAVYGVNQVQFVAQDALVADCSAGLSGISIPIVGPMELARPRPSFFAPIASNLNRC
jgi:methylase of polypeptide subunit release factors